MFTEVALITVSCVLFINMGLADAIQKMVHVQFRVVSCPKCLTFWTCLLWNVLHEYDLVLSVAASFLSSYCALWITLLLDSLALAYNYLYEQINKTTQDTSEASERATSPADLQASCDEVS